MILSMWIISTYYTIFQNIRTNSLASLKFFVTLPELNDFSINTGNSLLFVTNENSRIRPIDSPLTILPNRDQTHTQLSFGRAKLC